MPLRRRLKEFSVMRQYCFRCAGPDLQEIDDSIQGLEQEVYHHSAPSKLRLIVSVHITLSLRWGEQKRHNPDRVKDRELIADNAQQSRLELGLRACADSKGRYPSLVCKLGVAVRLNGHLATSLKSEVLTLQEPSRQTKRAESRPKQHYCHATVRNVTDGGRKRMGSGTGIVAECKQ